MEFKLLEVAGFHSAMLGMRYPTKSKGDSTYINNEFVLGDRDKRLAMSLLSKSETVNGDEIFKGDTHGKFSRSIVAWFNVDMPRYIWSELDTYSVGSTTVSSESTMYTLIKESKEITKDMFVGCTPQKVVDDFASTVDMLRKEYKENKHIPINIIKASLPEGWMQARVKSYSYQTLRRIYTDRKNHRLPEWQVVCNAIERLPYADELLFGGKYGLK